MILQKVPSITFNKWNATNYEKHGTIKRIYKIDNKRRAY